VSSTCYFILCNFSIPQIFSFLKLLVYLLIRVSLLTGQFSDHSISAFSVFLYCFTSSQTCDIWSVVCSPILQGHIELSTILYLYRYDLILPWPVTIIVRFGVTLIFNFNLSATSGKCSFVVTPFVVRSHSICHLLSFDIRESSCSLNIVYQQKTRLWSTNYTF